ncbi:Fur family transcriptional regulator [Desulfolutivibrio sulfoxidireducens]|uniref:Fur family transcriptional regulator n=1 Tax=Desulfolutivibrio sulfoxidireducens TaxID=2773299 RepID=UPI00159DF8D5|nr:transcriptional repressor [Desulfolutivibrio sulfoxidireducens]QLA17930.1 transcriptional repressor [Desulfolutivibrio sulfoxidireducens]QLA21507.1 transcriptional repressor [Desulfolutivibrio sulfoxidireducens]
MDASVSRLEGLVTLLRGRGRRITPQRLAILRVLARDSGHPSAEQVHARLVRHFPTMSLATVYKTIVLLKQAGEILELQFSELGNRYDGRRPYPHPHVICTGCGAIVDADDPLLCDAAERVARETGYDILTHRLDFFGLCPACREKRDTAGPTKGA